jgi:hypothetical protein
VTFYDWDRQRWWYKLAHVCRLWRNLILESPSRLDLHLYCTNGVPVVDMLAHSPPLPLTIEYHTIRGEMTTDDESGVFLALSHRNRVRYIWLWMPPNLKNLVTVMDDQFPILECIDIYSVTDSEVVLPVTFQAPNLRHLTLSPASLPIGSPLLTTAAGLVTLRLHDIPASAYFPPSYILTRFSLMTQLEKLSIEFKSPMDVERQLHQAPDMTTLPNLRRFTFTGVNAYLEALVARISAPSLGTLHVCLFHQLSFTVPHLLQFMQSSENLSFSSVKLALGECSVHVIADPWRARRPLTLGIICDHLDWQVASAMQIFSALSPVFSAVKQVTVSRDYESSAWHNDVDRRQWRELLRPFINAKTICVHDSLVDEILRLLLSHDGKPPLELLPNLEEVEHDGGCDAQDVLTAFVDERQVAGRPVNMVNLSLVYL